MDKFIFIDRDGVINEDPSRWGDDYVTRWDDFHFLPVSLEALKTLTDMGYKIAIISNQAGVGRGIYSKEALDEITAKMLEEIKAKGGRIYSVQYCVHKKEDGCVCRKPKTGLIMKAIEGLQVDIGKSYFIGDSKTDVEAGKAAGCRVILVLSGKVRDEKEAGRWGVKPDFIKKDLIGAVSVIENGG